MDDAVTIARKGAITYYFLIFYSKLGFYSNGGAYRVKADSSFSDASI